MTQAIVSEVASNLLFRYRVNCPRLDGGNSTDRSAFKQLPVHGRVPALSELDSDADEPFAELRAAWSPEGLYFWLKLKGKKQTLWCRNTQLLESDALQIWIDTRDTHNVHRATRFCHWFVLMPTGGGDDQKQPAASMLKINRAREHSPSLNQMPINVSSLITKSGYTLSAFIPAGTMTGWNTDEHRMIGFNYLLIDREMGLQTLGVGLQYPIQEDPSLWSTLALTG